MKFLFLIWRCWFISHNIFLGTYRFSGQKGEPRLAAAVTSPTPRDRLSDDVNVRGGRVPDLQHPAHGLERAWDVHRGSAAVDGADRQSAGDHQQQHQLHHLRDLRPEVQKDIPQAVLLVRSIRSGQSGIPDVRRIDHHQYDEYRAEKLGKARSSQPRQHHQLEQQFSSVQR